MKPIQAWLFLVSSNLFSSWWLLSLIWYLKTLSTIANLSPAGSDPPKINTISSLLGWKVAHPRALNFSACLILLRPPWWRKIVSPKIQISINSNKFQFKWLCKWSSINDAVFKGVYAPKRRKTTKRGGCVFIKRRRFPFSLIFKQNFLKVVF